MVYLLIMCFQFISIRSCIKLNWQISVIKGTNISPSAWVHSTVELFHTTLGWVAVKEHPDKCSKCPSWDTERPAACTRLGPSRASGTVLTGPAMSLTVALICSSLLKPFLQESRRACHSVKPGQGGKVTTLPPWACAGGVGVGGVQCSGFVVSLTADPLMSLWFPCQSVLIELPVVLLLHIRISCSRTVTRPSSVCLASADQTQLLCWILTTPLLLLRNMLPLRYAET